MSRWSFRFLLFFIVILFTQPQNRFPFLHPWRIANLMAILTIVTHILACAQEGKPFLRFGPATVLGLILMAMGLASLHIGPYQASHAWNPNIDSLMKHAVIMILVEAKAHSVARVWAVLTTITVSTLWWIKGGLRLGGAGVIYAGGRIMGPAVSMIENPNGFAYLMTATIPLYLYFFHCAANKYVRGFALFLALASTYIVFNTGSRSGLLCLIMCGIMVLPKLLKGHKTATLLGLLAIGAIWSQVDPKNVERFRSIGHHIAAHFSRQEEVQKHRHQMTQDEHSAWERKMKNRDTWRFVKDHPLLGAGINPDQNLYVEKYPHTWGQVHNEMLMAGTQFGFPGIMLYLSFLGFLLFQGLWLFKSFRGWWPDVSDLGYMFVAQAAIIFIGGMFATWPWHPYGMILCGAASALRQVAPIDAQLNA